MRRVEDSAGEGTLHLEFYQCGGNACGMKVALWYEVTGAGVSAEQMSFVERQVMKYGAFFPADYGR